LKIDKNVVHDDDDDDEEEEEEEEGEEVDADSDSDFGVGPSSSYIPSQLLLTFTETRSFGNSPPSKKTSDGSTENSDFNHLLDKPRPKSSIHNHNINKKEGDGGGGGNGSGSGSSPIGTHLETTDTGDLTHEEMEGTLDKISRIEFESTGL
jgi:hypothetical protein